MAVAKRAKKMVRRSISLPAETDEQIRKLADRQRQSANRVMENLIEAGLEAKEVEKRRFFELADHLRTASDPDELQHLKEELARMTFGS
jgi:hypothetical protein